MAVTEGTPARGAREEPTLSGPPPPAGPLDGLSALGFADEGADVVIAYHGHHDATQSVARAIDEAPEPA
jgi:hypothetical protein